MLRRRTIRFAEWTLLGRSSGLKELMVGGVVSMGEAMIMDEPEPSLTGVAIPVGEAIVSGVPAIVGGSSSSIMTGKTEGCPHKTRSLSKITFNI
jgi:hypothetical protein